jgi:hypothetical protein
VPDDPDPIETNAGSNPEILKKTGVNYTGTMGTSTRVRRMGAKILK